MAVLVLAEHDQGRLSPATARVVAAAAPLGTIDVLVAGDGVGEVAAAASALAGVAHVRIAESPALSTPTAEVLAPLLAELAGGYSYVVAASGAVGRDVIPRLAALLDVMPVTDVTAVLGADRFERQIYAGNAVERLISRGAPHLLTIRASAFAPAGAGNSAPVTRVQAAVPDAVVRLVATHRSDSDRPDLSTASVVVSGGIAVGSATGFEVVADLARRLGGAVGATRAAVDAGFAPNDLQVGQTGKSVAPALYVGLGISGAIQHLAGISGARTIVAVNTDPEAPLMQLADYALVGDLFEVVPALIAELDRLGVRRP